MCFYIISDHFWTVELALPFKDIVLHNAGATAPPKNSDQWRINFSRLVRDTQLY